MINEAAIRAAIRKLPATGSKAIELKDGGPRGEGRLCLSIAIKGERATTDWYAVWWRNEKRRYAKIGTFPKLSIADARKVFRADYAPIISGGGNPVSERAVKPRRGVTINDMFEAYCEGLEAAAKPSARMVRNALLGEKYGCAKALDEGMRAADVKPKDVRRVLADIYARDSITMAAACRTYMHAAFAWALKSANDYTSAVGLLDWGLEHNPVSAVPTDPKARRAGERFLTPAEMRTFWVWLEQKDAVSSVAKVPRLIMATGQRVSEILKISTRIYDAGEALLAWTVTKNGMPHVIPLPEQATALLKDHGANSKGLLFPNRARPSAPATLVSVHWLVTEFLKENPSIAPFTPRDLRRTWKTQAGAAGLSKEVRDRLQNHSKGDVSARHYDRYNYLVEKRAAMATWDAYLGRILAGELDNPVTQLRTAV
jgi:integrase